MSPASSYSFLTVHQGFYLDSRNAHLHPDMMFQGVWGFFFDDFFSCGADYKMASIRLFGINVKRDDMKAKMERLRAYY